MGNTTTMWRWDGSAWSLANNVWYWGGNAYVAANIIWRWDGTSWIPRYSTPVVACANVSGSNQGAADSGTVTSAAAAPSVGGRSSGSFSWAWSYVSGDNTLSISNASAQNPSWTATVSNGGSGPGGSGQKIATWQVLLTDTVTGATSTTNITVTLTWTNNEAALGVSGANANGSVDLGSGSGSATVSTGSGGSVGGCSPSGGSGIYTISWSYFSGDSGISINNSSIQNPTWSKSLSVGGGQTTSTSAVWEVSVTDNQGHGPVTTRINITLTLTSEQAALTVTGQDGLGWVDIGFFQGTYCTQVSSGAGVAPYGGQNGAAFPSGGSGSYNYSWSFVSGDNRQTINNASFQSPTWTSPTICTTGAGGSASSSAVWQCSVTDSQGHGPVTVNINVQLTLTIEND